MLKSSHYWNKIHQALMMYPYFNGSMILIFNFLLTISDIIAGSCGLTRQNHLSTTKYV